MVALSKQGPCNKASIVVYPVVCLQILLAVLCILLVVNCITIHIDLYSFST